METYFLTLRPQHIEEFNHVQQLARPLKRAAHPCPAGAELHIYNGAGLYDPHVHIVIETADIERFKSRITYFFKQRWRITYCAPARNALAATLYMSTKPDAEPVFYRNLLG